MSIDTFLLSADTTDLDYPEVRPTLDLNFARVKALDPRITFTRASGGSYVGADGLIKYSGVNEARFDHDPYTGESLGLLIEEARTNLIAYSGIPSANWAALNSVVVTNNSSTSPDGTTNATQIAGAALVAPGVYGVYVFTPTLTSGTIYTYSLFVKAVSGSNTIYFGTDAGTSATVRVNTSTGVASLNTGSPTNITSTSYPNGWYRISFTLTASVTEQHSFVIYNLTGNANTWLAWGAQIEVGSFPTSYIPTIGSTRTRAADNAIITGKNFSEWYRQDEGTVFATSQIPSGAAANSSSRALCDFTDGSSNNRMVFRALVNSVDSATPVQGLRLRSGNIIINTLYGNGALVSTASASQAFAYKVDDLSLSVTGSASVVTATSGALPVSVNQIQIGCELGLTEVLSGTIRRLTYYPKRLPNAQLQALTR